MHDFESVIARDLEECLRTLAAYGSDAAVLAGGTDLYILMKTGLKMPKLVIYVGNVSELKMVECEDGCVSIGAGLTHFELTGLEAIDGINCLSEGAAAIGSPQIRNVGTVGGNIANASPAGDLYPPLLVLDATLELRSLRRTREVRLEDFVSGPGITTLEPDEVVTGVRLKRPEGKFFSGFAKVGLRNALAISVASAAIVATCKDGKFDKVRIACGAVAPQPIRMTDVEDLLVGQHPADDLIKQAAEVASRICDPITDIRATRDYRRHVAGVIVSRLVEDAWRNLIGYDKEWNEDA